jgi:hypothetical protein
VFPYFTDPGRYVQWMGSGATLEPVPGGTYRIRMRGGVEEMRKPNPDGAVIATLMRRFVLTAGITGVMQVATLIIMTRVATQ